MMREDSAVGTGPVVRGTRLRTFDPSASEALGSTAHHVAVLTAMAAGAAAGLVYLADGERLRMVGAWGLRDGWQVLQGIPVSETVAGLVLARRSPIVVDDVGRDGRVPPSSPIFDHGGRAYAGYPIADGDGETVGVCAAMDYRPRHWEPRELTGIETSAKLCTALLRDLATEAEVGRRQGPLDAARFLDTERAVGHALAEALGIEQAGPTVLRAVCSSLGWSAGELWLADDDTDALRPVATYRDGDRPGLPVPPQLARGAGLAGSAWELNEVVWVRDLNGIDGATIRSGVAVPVPFSGSALGALCFFTDVVRDAESAVTILLTGIAGQVAQFLQRRRAEDAELALARSKDEYLFLVGHELRTPLTSIASYTELLVETPGMDAENVRLLGVIDRNTSRLRHIIDELLDLAALDSGHAELVWERLELATIVEAALADTRADADEAGVALRAELEPGLHVDGDGERIRQVLDHLLRNAVTHSPRGTVTVSTAGSATGAVDLVVADTGVGIPDDEGVEVLSPFYRTVLSREQQLPGAGLGLALSRAIVQAHRGTIRLMPNRPQGTRAAIRLPRA
ncbi:sensor histidine kinase [Cryptosporangium arvum]|uniref:histidine kinase n=1 Tax=Cryptosporangium arvum DSM 44712 TaxID=927661 RepID=A0A010ZXA3_9ACTN|nr:ATP-binding protein [Cryptosporangium arvum]EXG81857.1 histidine kinase with GAF domain [Cryptosporangium arvum DSM 44712]